MRIAKKNRGNLQWIADLGTSTNYLETQYVLSPGATVYHPLVTGSQFGGNLEKFTLVRTIAHLDWDNFSTAQYATLAWALVLRAYGDDGVTPLASDFTSAAVWEKAEILSSGGFTMPPSFETMESFQHVELDSRMSRKVNLREWAGIYLAFAASASNIANCDVYVTAGRSLILLH